MQNCELIKTQHQMIRLNISSLIERLDVLKKDPTAVNINQLKYDLKHLIQFVEAHSRYEEEILIPLISEMYSSATELMHYVEDDHKLIEKDFEQILQSDLDIQGNIRKVKSILNRIIIHLEEEERGLIPLVEMFLKQTKREFVI